MPNQQQSDLLLLANNSESIGVRKGINGHSSLTGASQLNGTQQAMTQIIKDGSAAFDPLQAFETSRIRKVLKERE